MNRNLFLTLLFLCNFSLAQETGALWGKQQGAMRGNFTRCAELTERARPIDAIDQDQPFSLRFRFKTLDQGSYAGLAFIGIRLAGSPFKSNAAGVTIFRHNEKMGLIGNVFVADASGAYHESREAKVSLAYDTAYDVLCTYAPSEGLLRATFFDVVAVKEQGAASLTVPEGIRWNTDRLACWNYADGHNDRSRITLILDNIALNEERILRFDSNLEELPLGESQEFSWYQAPALPLISELKAPEEIFDQEALFSLRLRKELKGSITFSLQHYDGREVWTAQAPISSRTASVDFPTATASALEKGTYVLVATLNGSPEEEAYRALRLRGRRYYNAFTEPAGIQAGDEIIIDDFSTLKPREAIRESSTKGAWWRRAYTLADETENHSLICVEEHDLEDPESCLAPVIRLPLDFKGWYEIWVRSYRHQENGGIDVRLSDEPYFFHCDPMQVDRSDAAPAPRYGALVDIRYRATEFSGQDLLFQQPYGSYHSTTKRCNAALAGLRLVKLSDQEVARLQARRADSDHKRIAYDNDGFSYFHFWATQEKDCVARLLEPLRDSSTAFFNLELGGLGGLIIPTPYTGMYQMTGHTRHGDYRANEFYQWAFENEVDIVSVLTERAHEVGLKLFVSLMMERSFSVDQTMKKHPEWMIQRGRGRWDYALPAVQDYQIEKIIWIMEHHDIDGFIVDFTRYGYYFNEDEKNKFGHMNAFLRKLRQATDALNEKKDRKILLCASFGDRSWHLTHWGTGKLEDQGLDVDTWLTEDLFDMLMPEGPSALDFVEQAKESKTEVWPRFVQGVNIEKHQGVGGAQGPKTLERGVDWAYDQGAPGIFFFNYDTWSSMAQLGFRDELKMRAKTQAIFGFIEGPKITFTSWCPNAEQETTQRASLKPLTVALESDGSVAAPCSITLTNTFPIKIEARLTWEHSEAATWRIDAPGKTLPIEAGQSATDVFNITTDNAVQKTAPFLNIEFVEANQVLFRHRSPLRAVRQTTCHRASAPPVAIDPEAQPFFSLGNNDPGIQTRMKCTYDDEAFYVLVDCQGVDIEAIPRETEKRDDRSIDKAAHVVLLIDTDCAEEAFLELVATPAGGQSDSRRYYDQFAGHFRQNRKWNADWSTQTRWKEDGYSLLFRIPFEALGAKPVAGDQWRFSVIAESGPGSKKKQLEAWGSPNKSHHSAAALGLLHFK